MKRRSLFGALLAGIAAPAVTQLPTVAPAVKLPDLGGHVMRTAEPPTHICWAMYDPAPIYAHTHTVGDPGHSHQLWDASHNHSVTDPGHSHALLTYPFVGEVRAFSSLAAVPIGWKVCDGMNGTPDLRHRWPLRA